MKSKFHLTSFITSMFLVSELFSRVDQSPFNSELHKTKALKIRTREKSWINGSRCVFLSTSSESSCYFHNIFNKTLCCRQILCPLFLVTKVSMRN